MSLLRNRIFYTLKPLIPRHLQIAARRMIVRNQLMKNKHIWPIDEKASKPPVDWQGWPDGKKFAFVLMHDVDTEMGQSKCRQLMQLDMEMGVRSLFSFVPEGYAVSSALRKELVDNGFEIGVHGLKHDGKLFLSKELFSQRAQKINNYLKEWESVGFVSPSMQRKLDWMHELHIEYDTSSFDTDPFEPQPEGLSTIYPIFVHGNNGTEGYVELPYTLPQDFTLYVLMKETNIDIWKKKIDWIAEHGGMALLITHPDYMNFNGSKKNPEEYPAEYYREMLAYIKSKYDGQYWHVLPKEMTQFWNENYRVKTNSNLLVSCKKKVWIDLDNSPHVVFFKPIIDELERRGYSVILTARDCFQTCGLADIHKLKYKRIGKHYGKYLFLKVIGLLLRALQLIPVTVKERPALALSHGSRAQALNAYFFKIPSIIIADYEHATMTTRPDWVIVPEVIPDDAIKINKKNILRYAGIKEDVYVPDFVPDPTIMDKLGINDKKIIITIRPPASEAHYRNPRSEELFKAVIGFLDKREDVIAVLLPRNERQAAQIRKAWSYMCEDGKIIVPKEVIGGLNLLWHSDLVISGGGTMNREAAALGIPVYSIFQGKLGAVDRWLAQKGRLVLIKSDEDINQKIKIEKRVRTELSKNNIPRTLADIVSHIENVISSTS